MAHPMRRQGIVVATASFVLLGMVLWAARSVHDDERSRVLVQQSDDAAVLASLQSERRGLTDAIAAEQGKSPALHPTSDAAMGEVRENLAGIGREAGSSIQEGCGHFCQMRKMIVKARNAVDKQAKAECSQLAGGCATIPPTFRPAVQSSHSVRARTTPLVPSAPVRTAPVWHGTVQTGTVQTGTVQAGVIQRGAIQYAQRPSAPLRPRIYQHVIFHPPVGASGDQNDSSGEAESESGNSGSSGDVGRPGGEGSMGAPGPPVPRDLTDSMAKTGGTAHRDNAARVETSVQRGRVASRATKGEEGPRVLMARWGRWGRSDPRAFRACRACQRAPLAPRW